MRILVVEDEKNLNDLVSERLKHADYTVDSAYDGETGLDYVLKDIYDLVILDLMLPGVDGMYILRRMKEESVRSKVLILTAKGEIEDKMKAFGFGAHDYLTKPFHLEELIARVNVHLNRNDEEVPRILQFEDLVLNLRTSMISSVSSGEEIEVSHKEYLLLEYFINNPKQVITKNQIYDKVWGLENTVESNSLEAYLSFIRRKFRSIDVQVNIRAIRGLGYKLEGTNEKSKN